MARDPQMDEIVARYASATVDEFVATHARDVSESGMLVRSSCALPVGKLVNFEVRLSNDEVVLSGAGRIAWKRDAKDADRPAGVAVKFVDLDDASRALVDRLLAAKGNAVGEFDRAPAPPETAKTVLGLGSPFLVGAVAVPEPVGSASPPAADEARSGTKLGLSPPVVTPEKRTRVGTHLGLAPPVAPAGLVLGEQSLHSLEALPAARGEATSDIDAGWGDEGKTGNSEAAPPSTLPPQAAARISQIPTVEVKVTDLAGLRDLVANVAATPEGKAARSARSPATEIVDAPDPVPRRRPLLWIMLLLTAAAFGVYEYESSGEPSEDSSKDAPSPVAPSPVAPAPSSTPAAANSASPVKTTSASAVSSAVTIEGSRAAPPTASSSPIARSDAGKHQAPPKSSGGTTGTRAAPSASGPAKPRVPPKTTPAEDNPY